MNPKLNKVECCDVNNCHYDLSGDMFQRIYGSSTSALTGVTGVAGAAGVTGAAGVMEGDVSVTVAIKPIKPRQKTTSVLHWIDQSAYLPNRTKQSRLNLYPPAAVNSGDASSGGSSGGGSKGNSSGGSGGSKGNSTVRLKKAGLMRYALAYVPSGCKVNRFTFDLRGKRIKHGLIRRGFTVVPLSPNSAP